MQKENPFYILVFPGILFLIVAIVFVGVITANQIKAGNYIGLDLEKERTIFVSGEGKVTGEPDFAAVTFSVVNEAETADKAIQQNAEKMNKILDFLKSQEIDSNDLKTTNVSVSPRYEYRTGEMDYPYPSGERVLVAYQANQSLGVKIRNLEKTGLIIEGAVDAGANQTSGLIFDIESQTELKNKAREMAIEDAKEKAEKLGNQLGVKLKNIISYNENDQTPYLIRESMAMDSMEVSGKGGSGIEIEPGENEIKIIVNIGYEIQY